MESNETFHSISPIPRARRRLKIAGVVTSVIVILSLIAAMCIWKAERAYFKIVCASNLQQIGRAIQMYADGHQGQLPGSFREVLATQDISPEVFCCAGTDDTRANGPTTRAVLDAFEQPGHCSYIYLGAGQRWTNDPLIVLAYEPMKNHHETQMNVLFGDGHVELLPNPGALPWIAAGKGGPVTRPAAE